MYPWGAPPRVSSRHPGSPREVSPPITFSEKVGKTPRALDVAHSSFVQFADQDGELTPVDCLVFRADRHPLRHAEVVAQPPDGQGLSARHV